MQNRITFLRVPLSWTKITSSAVNFSQYQPTSGWQITVGKHTLPLVNLISSDMSWRVTVKPHDWGECSSATSFTRWTLMVYSLPNWKHNLMCWSPQHITEPAHASRLRKCDAFQLWSAVTQQKSDWWYFICDASLRVELHLPHCQ